ncbi:hypothetical protein DD237_000221 [Peronospora effusa]|uniref:Large ribosomal subunit protein eL24-related N-terminal domain-containing protein n=1 Tax=Peronospora effusa TaxID=542832 RepID=A0A3R7Y7Q0_9STRA|nr:hypothetical protein DD237_000221 [Peronospora effusa]
MEVAEDKHKKEGTAYRSKGVSIYFFRLFSSHYKVISASNVTETCSLSESASTLATVRATFRRDGSAYVFINAKSKSLFMQRKKATKIVWTLG